MLPYVSWTELVPLDTKIELYEIGHVDENISQFELEVIARLARHHQPHTVFEIGTFDGRTTLNIAANSAADAHVHTLDLPPRLDAALPLAAGERLFIDKEQSGARFLGSDMASRITQVFGDSGTFDFSPFRGKVDFIFVDGSHSYPYVLNDSREALTMARPGAIILWHDYVADGATPWPGVPEALHELFKGNADFAGLRQIAGTTIVMLQMPGGRPRYTAKLPAIFGDSTQPEHLHAELKLELEASTVQSGSEILARVQAVNTGRAIWLPEGSPIGPVRLGTQLVDINGDLSSASYSRSALPTKLPIEPGQVVNLFARLPSPPRGQYVIVFDLVAEGVAWFSRNGSKQVRVPLNVV